MIERADIVEPCVPLIAGALKALHTSAALVLSLDDGDVIAVPLEGDGGDERAQSGPDDDDLMVCCHVVGFRRCVRGCSRTDR